MKSAYSLIWLVLTFRHSEQGSCKYGGRGSLMSICTEVTSSYFKTTTYRFTHLDEHVQCINCTLTILENNNFDFNGNRIRILDLTSSEIAFLKPKAFIGLIFLERLLLGSNRITTVPPMTFLGINKVEHLDVQDNRITSLVTNGFKELKNLKRLLLQNNNINVIEKDAFNGLTALETLDLSHNYISVVREVLDGLYSLRLLNLDKNEIQEVASGDLIKNPESLVQLSLAQNRIKTITADTFLSFTRLETLNISTNPLALIVVGSFRGLGALEDLDLSNCALPEVPKASLLALHNLRALDLSRNKLETLKTGTYSGLPELRKLNLSRNVIETYAKTGIFPLNRLHTLDLSYNKLEDLDYKQLVAHMPTLTYLNMASNPWRCYILEEMEKEFEHDDNFYFTLGADFNKTGDVECNVTKARLTSTDDNVCENEKAPFGGNTTHEYLLYAFILISAGLMAYMFYMECKNQRNLKKIVTKINMAEAQLIHSGDPNDSNDY